MKIKVLLTPALALASTAAVLADPPTPGSVWGHDGGTPSVSYSPMTSMYGDPLAHSIGDLVTIVVDLQDTVTQADETKTAKTTAVQAAINALLYPIDGSNKGYNFYTYHGQAPTQSWNSAQSFDGTGSINNNLAASTTIQARVIEVESNGVLRIQATRLNKTGEEATTTILTGLVRPDDLSTTNTISSSRVSDLQIIQKGKGTITNNTRKGWLTKFYEFIEPF